MSNDRRQIDLLLSQGVAASLPEAQRSARLFAGELLVFEPTPAASALVSLVGQRLCEALGDSQPPSAHRRMSRDEWLQRIGVLQRRFARDGIVRDAFRQALSAVGVDPQLNAWDRCVLRALPPGDLQQSARRGYVHPHRDSWGANLPAQVNWWMPIYPLSERRTLQFFPDYWAQPVANTTAEWRYSEFLAARRQADPNHRADYPSAPRVLESLAQARRQIVPINPGQWLAFSSAQLHGSVANHTELARFSVELRTLNLDDLRAGRGAIEVDNAGRDGPRYEWFRRLADEQPLVELMAAG